jgi:hypothetical protein
MEERMIDHATLVRAGKQWLLNQRYRVVATELKTSIGEVPDVMGWRNKESCMIECKTSRADFFADHKKVTRRFRHGVGNRCWYLVPAGLLRTDELPPGWGLAEYRESAHTRGYYIKRVVEADHFVDEHLLFRERQMLVSIAWRALEAQRLVRPLAISGDDECFENADQ